MDVRDDAVPGAVRASCEQRGTREARRVAGSMGLAATKATRGVWPASARRMASARGLAALIQHSTPIA